MYNHKEGLFSEIEIIKEEISSDKLKIYSYEYSCDLVENICKSKLKSHYEQAQKVIDAIGIDYQIKPLTCPHDRPQATLTEFITYVYIDILRSWYTDVIYKLHRLVYTYLFLGHFCCRDETGQTFIARDESAIFLNNKTSKTVTSTCMKGIDYSSKPFELQSKKYKPIIDWSPGEAIAWIDPDKKNKYNELMSMGFKVNAKKD